MSLGPAEVFAGRAGYKITHSEDGTRLEDHRQDAVIGRRDVDIFRYGIEFIQSHFDCNNEVHLRPNTC